MTIFTGVILDETHTSPEFTVGGRFEDEDGKVYKYVLFSDGTGNVAAVAGNVVYYGASSTTTVTSDLSDSVNVGAGVLVGAPADSEYCWVQIKGEATLATSLTAGADGNALTAVGATDGTLDVSAAVTDAVVAYAIDASEDLILCDFPE